MSWYNELHAGTIPGTEERDERDGQDAHSGHVGNGGVQRHSCGQLFPRFRIETFENVRTGLGRVVLREVASGEVWSAVSFGALRSFRDAFRITEQRGIEAIQKESEVE